MKQRALGTCGTNHRTLPVFHEYNSSSCRGWQPVSLSQELELTEIRAKFPRSYGPATEELGAKQRAVLSGDKRIVVKYGA